MYYYESNDDTDSIVNQCLGDSLGEWTDELGTNVTIDELLIMGPKNYGYELSDGTTKRKVKGFRVKLNAEAN